MCDYNIDYNEMSLSQKKEICINLSVIAMIYIEQYGSADIINDSRQYLQMIVKEKTNNFSTAAQNRLFLFSNECGEMEEYTLHYLATKVLERYIVYKSVNILLGYNLCGYKCYGFVDLIDIANVLDESIFCHANKLEITFEQAMVLIKSHEVKEHTVRMFNSLVNSIRDNNNSQDIVEKYKNYIYSILNTKII